MTYANYTGIFYHYLILFLTNINNYCVGDEKIHKPYFVSIVCNNFHSYEPLILISLFLSPQKRVFFYSNIFNILVKLH